MESIGVEFSDFHSGVIVTVLDIHPLKVILPLESCNVVFAIDNLVPLIDHLERLGILTPLFLGLAHDRCEKGSVRGFLLESSHHPLLFVIFQKVKILKGSFRKYLFVGSIQVCITIEIDKGVNKLVVLEIVYITFLGEALDDVHAGNDLNLFLFWLHIIDFNSLLNFFELGPKSIELGFVFIVDSLVFPSAFDSVVQRKH